MYGSEGVWYRKRYTTVVSYISQSEANAGPQNDLNVTYVVYSKQ